MRSEATSARSPVIGWTSALGFRPELTPSWLTVACLLAGQHPPDFTGPFRVAYLGSAPGVTAAVTAAAHPDADVWAWGLRPEDVEATRRLRDAAVLDNLTVHERPGLPLDLGGDVVDLVVIDRVLDSCDDDLRATVVDALAESLRPGGLAVVSYRTTVGWAEITPVLAVMRRVAERQPGDATDRARVALEALRQLRSRGTRHLTDRPWVVAWLNGLLALDPEQVAAEYLTAPLRPLSHVAVDDLLAESACAYVGSACLSDELLEGVPAELAELVDTTRSVRLREAYRDLATRPLERIDMFRKGLAPLSSSDASDMLNRLELTDLTGQEDPSTIPIGELGDGADGRLLRTLLAAGEAYPSVVGGTGPTSATRWASLEREWGAG